VILFADAPGLWNHLLNLLVLLTGLFLILIVLIQRGKGGGLAGALGAAGGSSAFGSRAGDTFTKITIGLAAAWILLLMLQVKTVDWTVKMTEEPTGTLGTGPGP
jgi:preprotein translocase subunit SecG